MLTILRITETCQMVGVTNTEYVTGLSSSQMEGRGAEYGVKPEDLWTAWYMAR